MTGAAAVASLRVGSRDPPRVMWRFPDRTDVYLSDRLDAAASSLATVAERDVVLTYALRAFKNAGVTKRLAFKGGSWLRKGGLRFCRANSRMVRRS
jgi:diaminopimelate decarboxylase